MSQNNRREWTPQVIYIIWVFNCFSLSTCSLFFSHFCKKEGKKKTSPSLQSTCTCRLPAQSRAVCLTMSLDCPVVGILNQPSVFDPHSRAQSGWVPTSDAQRCSSTVRVQRQPPNTDLSHEREFSVSSRQCLLHVPDHENQLGCLLMIQILELRLRSAKLESQGGLRICILVTISGEPCDQGSLRTRPWAAGSRGGF